MSKVIEAIRIASGARSRPELAKKLGMKPSDVDNALRGKSQSAYGRILAEAEKRNWIASDKGTGKIVHLTRAGMARVRVVGAAMAGAGSDNHPDEFDQEVPSTMLTGIEFGFQVEDVSLMDKIMPEDILIARPYKTPMFNRLMIVRRPDGSVSAKIVAWDKDRGEAVLRSTDGRPDEPANVEFMGVVTGLYRYKGGPEKSVIYFPGLRYEDLAL